MQQVLALDLCSSIAHAAVVRLDESGISVLESHSAEIKRPGESLLIESDEQAAPVQEEASNNGLKNLLEQFESFWSASIVILNSKDYLSLLLTLPFKDKKTIDKIIDLELQDLVPFSMDEFLVDHRYVKSSGENQHRIHVSMLPRYEMATILELCRASSLEPHYVTSAGSALGALFSLSNQSLDRDSVIIHFLDDSVILCGIADGAVFIDRTIPFSQLSDEGNTEKQLNLVRAELFKTISHWEHEEAVSFSSIYCISTNDIAREVLDERFPRAVRFVAELTDVVKTPASPLLGLASHYALHGKEEEPLADFRVREFAFKPQLQRLIQGIRPLFVPLLLTAILFVAYMAVSFVMEERNIASQRQAMVEQVHPFLPGVQSLSANADIVQYVQSQASLAEKELTQLGSPSSLSPLDLFKEISQAIAKAQAKTKDLGIDSISIDANGIVIEGYAPDYSQAEQLNRVLEQKKDLFCTINRETRSVAGRGSRGFRFTLTLCEV